MVLRRWCCSLKSVPRYIFAGLDVLKEYSRNGPSHPRCRRSRDFMLVPIPLAGENTKAWESCRKAKRRAVIELFPGASAASLCRNGMAMIRRLACQTGKLVCNSRTLCFSLSRSG